MTIFQTSPTPELPANLARFSATNTAARLTARESRALENQQRLLQEDERAERPSLVGASIGLDSPIAGYRRGVDRERHGSVDFDWPQVFSLSRADREQFTAGIPQEYWGELFWTPNAEYAMVLADQLRDRAANERRIAEAGVGGMAARMATMMVMPDSLLLSAAVGVVAGPLAAGAQATRLARLGVAAKAGVAGGATNVLLDSIAYSDDPNHTVNDLMFSAAAGFGVSGVLSYGIDAGRARMAARRIQNNIARAEMIHAARLQNITINNDILNATYSTPRTFDPDEIRTAFFLSPDGDFGIDESVLRPLLAASDVPENLFTKVGMNAAEVEAFNARVVTALPDDIRTRVRPQDQTGPERLSEDLALGDTPSEVVARTEARGTPAAFRDEPDASAGPLGPTLEEYRSGIYGPRDLEDSPEGFIVSREPLEGTHVFTNEAGTIDADGVAMGAMSQFALKVGDMAPIQLTDTESSLSFLRIGMAARLGKSSKEVREFSNAMMLDANVKKGGQVQALTAEETIARWNDAALADWYSVLLEHGPAWHMATGGNNAVPFAYNPRAQQKFGEAITRAVRSGVVPEDPALAAGVRAFQTRMDDMLELAQRHGVLGSQKIARNLGYVPRITVTPKIERAVEMHGEARVTEVVETALRNGWEGDPTDVDFRSLAKLWLNIHRNEDAYTAFDRAEFARRGMTEEFWTRELTRQLDAGMINEEAFNESVNLFRRLTSDQGRGVPTRFRLRLTMDESTSIVTEAGVLRIDEMFENNATLLMENYVRSVHGEIGMARVIQAMNEKYTTANLRDYTDLRNFLARTMKRDKLSEGKINRDLRRLDAAHAILTNRRPQAYFGKEYDNLARILSLLNYVRLSGGFGFAQMPEMGGVAGAVHLRNLSRVMPEFKKALSGIRYNELPRDSIEELGVLAGLGGSRIRQGIQSRGNDFSDVGQVGGRVEGSLRVGARVAADANFQMAFMDRQRNAIFRLGARSVATDAWRKSRIGKTRLRLMGIDEAMEARIVAQIKRHGEPASTRPRDIDFNTSQWEDIEAAAAFFGGLRRWSEQAIQGNKIGSLTPFMTEPVGRLIMQFRMFPLQAWENHLLLGAQRLSMGDFGVFYEHAMTFAFAALAVSVQEHIRTAGMANQDEVLEERLEPSKLAASAFQRASFSSFSPDILNMGWGLLGGQGDPPFFNRNTGLRPGMLTPEAILSNPTFDLAGRGPGAVADLAQRLRTGEPVNSRDAQNMVRLLPFHRLPVIDTILGSLAEQFPEPP